MFWELFAIIVSALAAAAVALIGIMHIKKHGYFRGNEAVIRKYAYRRLSIYSDEQIAENKSRKKAFGFGFTLPYRAPFVVICPGGGYGGLALEKEGINVAKKYNEAGYNAFVLYYRYGRYARFPAPQEDLASMVKYVFDNADRLNIDTAGYAVVGFSAGGHLAASFCVKQTGYAIFGVKPPKVAILGYPVVTMREDTHVGSRSNLLGENASLELKDLYSIEVQADKDYPAAYIWRRDKDCVVPGVGADKLVERLNAIGVANEYDIYEGTEHGDGLGVGTAVESWFPRSITFLNEQRTK